MKYLKWLNLIPLVMFIAMDVFLEAKIYPIRMVAVAGARCFKCCDE